MDTLPLDVLKYLATFLDLISLCRFFQVCKTFHKLSADNYFWTHKLKKDYPKSDQNSCVCAKKVYYQAYYRQWKNLRYTYASELRDLDEIYQRAKEIYEERDKHHNLEEMRLQYRLDRLLAKNMTPTYIYREVHLTDRDYTYGQNANVWVENIIGQKIQNGMLVHIKNNSSENIYFFVYEDDTNDDILTVQFSHEKIPYRISQLSNHNKWTSDDIREIFKIPFKVVPAEYGCFKLVDER